MTILKRNSIISMALALLLFAAAGCAEKSSGRQSTDNGGSAREYTVSTSPAEGWTAVSDNVTLLRYRKDSGDFWVRQSYAGPTIEGDIESYKEKESQSKYEFVWKEATDAKVGGMDAKQLNYTVDTGSLKMGYNVYFIQKDAALFLVVCLTMPDSDYAGLETDYKAMLDALTITEK